MVLDFMALIVTIYNNFLEYLFSIMFSPQDVRKNRLASIRSSLQEIPIFKQTTIVLQTKLQKRARRKQSLKLEDIKITESQINQIIEKDEEVKYMGKFQQKYLMEGKIGQGSDGFVRKCYLRATNQLFAVKTMNMNEEQIQFLKKNFKYIKALNHPNIIRYHVMYLDSKSNFCRLVMDYDGHPNLLKFPHLPQSEIKQIIYQLINTICYIHSQNICHRDIKPENILYDQANKKIKLIDFGISKKFIQRETKRDMLTFTGTLFYKAPEMFTGGGYNEKVDMWAVGITLYQLINNGNTPFQSEYSSNTIDNILRGEVEYPEEIWNNYSKFAKDLVVRLLKNSNERLSAVEAKKHLWFSQSQFSEVDITKSASFFPKIIQRIKKNQSETEQTFKIQRSMTMVKTDSLIDVEGKSKQKVKMKLNRWLDMSDDEDVLLDIESQGQEKQQIDQTV